MKPRKTASASCRTNKAAKANARPIQISRSRPASIPRLNKAMLTIINAVKGVSVMKVHDNPK